MAESETLIQAIWPFFIVRDLAESVRFYRERLGFDPMYVSPSEDPLFAILSREGARLMVKSVGVEPSPNVDRHPYARWDAYISVSDPERLADEYLSRGVLFQQPLQVDEDGLFGFTVRDHDGYVLFFGRPA